MMEKGFKHTPDCCSFLSQPGYIIQANFGPVRGALGSVTVNLANKAKYANYKQEISLYKEFISKKYKMMSYVVEYKSGLVTGFRREETLLLISGKDEP